MGNQQGDPIYSVPIAFKSEHPGESIIRRHPDCLTGLIDTPQSSLLTLLDVWNNSVKHYGKAHFLGTKLKDKSEYQFRTYEEVDRIAGAIGTSVRKLSLLNTEKYLGLEFNVIGIFSKNRREWSQCDIASIKYGFQLVPLYDTLGPQSLDHILRQTQIRSCFVSEQTLKTLCKLQTLHNLCVAITFDSLSEETKKLAGDKKINIIQYSALLAETQVHPPVPVTPDHCYSFSYTSGSTALPKGAMLSHRNMVAICAALKFHGDINIYPHENYLSYLPFPHVMERAAFCLLFYSGAVINFYSGDVQKIKDDIQLSKPKLFVSVPRLYNRFHDVIKQQFNKQTGVKKALLQKAIATKLHNLRTTGECTHSVYDKLIFNKTKQMAFGGQMRIMVTGSAPLATQVIEFIKIVSCVALIEGYGQTQSTAVSFLVSSKDRVSGHVGGPVKTIEFKVVDVPEMNYLSTDKTDGESTPRGEICIRGSSVFMGYFKDEEKTKEAVDEHGWLHTGDIGIILPNGALKIIDRKKNIFKLQQGEYVAPQKIQNVYMRALGVAEVFLHGQSLQNFTVAIIHPSKDYLLKFAKQKGLDLPFEQLCSNKQVRLQILANLTAQGKKDGLTGFEQAKNVHLEKSSFLAKGCFTNTLKLKRFQAKKVFEQQIKALYKEGMLK